MYIHVVNICMCIFIYVLDVHIILCVYLQNQNKKKTAFYLAFIVRLACLFTQTPWFQGISDATNTLLMRAYACLHVRVLLCLCCGFVVYFNVGQLMSSVITRIDHVPPHVGCSLLIFMINFAAQWGDTVCTHARLPLLYLPHSPFTCLLMYSL